MHTLSLIWALRASAAAFSWPRSAEDSGLGDLLLRLPALALAAEDAAGGGATGAASAGELLGAGLGPCRQMRGGHGGRSVSDSCACDRPQPPGLDLPAELH